MAVSTEAIAAYESGRGQGAREALANVPTPELRIIAARGMRIAAVREEATLLSPARNLDQVLAQANKKASRLGGAALLGVAAKAVGLFHKHDHKPGTAASLTRILKGEDAPVMRYALDKRVTGALVSLKMRVRRPKSAGPTPGMSQPRKGSDVIAMRMIDARNRTINDVQDAILAAENAPNARLRHKHVSRVRAILHTWQADPAVVHTARMCGWRV